jgi:phage repressor protein C with HTH and peptisase S24 domain
MKLTQKEVSKAAGVSAVSVTLWEKGDTAPKGENLIAISKLLKCSPEWLLSGKGGIKIESNAELIGPIEAWDNKTPLDDDEVEIPFLTEVQLAAGNGMLATRENFGPKLRFAKSALIRNGTDIASAVCVKVSGNSMEPIMPDGSTIGIDTAKTNIIDGKVYAITHGEMQRVKMLYRLPDGGVRLKSYNNEEHPEEVYTKEQTEEIKVIGKVFWCSFLL